MRFVSLALLACLAACSADDAGAPANNVAAIDTAGAKADPAAAVPDDAPDSHAKPAPGELGTFKDWTVGCDNVKACKAVALSPADADAETLMSIARAGGPDGAFTVRITGSKLPSLPAIVAIDGKPVARGGTLVDQKSAVEFTAADAHAIAMAAPDGGTLTIQGAKGDSATISLAGLSAALRYIDAEQGIAGTGTAIVARGDGKAAGTALKLPVIRAVTASGDPVKLSDDQIAALRKADSCAIADYMPDPPGADYAALGGGRTLMLMPCDSGAYNMMAIAYVIGADGKPVRAEFDSATGMGEPDEPVQLVNAAFDGRVLSTFAKARGLGDCGVTQQWVWDGATFRLAEQAEMGECRGSIDYITTWRAKVLR